MPRLRLHLCFTGMLCWLAHEAGSFALPNATELLSPPSSAGPGPAPGTGVPRGRRRRSLAPREVSAILDYHNQVRAQVSPPAANMEYMVSAHRSCRGAGGCWGLWLIPGVFCTPGAGQTHVRPELSSRRGRAGAGCDPAHPVPGQMWVPDFPAPGAIPPAASWVFLQSQHCREAAWPCLCLQVLHGDAAGGNKAAGTATVPSGTWLGMDQLLTAWSTLTSPSCL